MSFSCFDPSVIFEEVTNKLKGNVLPAGITVKHSQVNTLLPAITIDRSSVGDRCKCSD